MQPLRGINQEGGQWVAAPVGGSTVDLSELGKIRTFRRRVVRRKKGYCSNVGKREVERRSGEKGKRIQIGVVRNKRARRKKTVFVGGCKTWRRGKGKNGRAPHSEVGRTGVGKRRRREHDELPLSGHASLVPQVLSTLRFSALRQVIRQIRSCQNNMTLMSL